MCPSWGSLGIMSPPVNDTTQSISTFHCWLMALRPAQERYALHLFPCTVYLQCCSSTLSLWYSFIELLAIMVMFHAYTEALFLSLNAFPHLLKMTKLLSGCRHCISLSTLMTWKTSTPLPSQPLLSKFNALSLFERCLIILLAFALWSFCIFRRLSFFTLETPVCTMPTCLHGTSQAQTVSAQYTLQ